MARARVSWIGGALLAATLAACGGTSPAALSVPPAASVGSPAASSAASQAANPAVQALYEKAKAEGQVVWYAPNADDVIEPVAQAFMKAYPGIKVTHSVEKQQQMFSDIQVQQAAKHVTIDVAETANDVADTLTNHMPLATDWAKLGVAPDRTLQDVVEIAGSNVVVTYNTQKVSAADAPKTWDDLLDPKWQGKMAIDGRASWAPVFMAASDLGGQSKGVDFARRLSDQKPLFQTSNSAIEPLLISGQASVGTDDASSLTVALRKSPRPPLDLAPVTPVYEATSFAYVPDGAPHSSAAQLLVAWLSSSPGQAALNAAGTGSLTPCDANPDPASASGIMCAHKVQYVKFNQLSQFQQIAAYQKQVQQALGTFVGN
jgi:iron(III) transport system substrate-binding protein